MFSYLRPRSRNAANTPDAIEPGKPLSSDYSNQFLPAPKHHPPPPPIVQDSSEQYVSPVSARAPILPPIPRVASIYGTPEEVLNPEEQQNGKGKAAAIYHSRVQSIEEDKVSQSFDSPPQSAGGNARTRNNFSRPFHIREGSNTPSEEREKMQQIWRTAVQTTEPQRKRPQPMLDTTIVEQAPPVHPIRSASRFYRMPFQEGTTSPAREPISPQKLSLVPPHGRQASEGAIPQTAGVPRTYPARPSDSQLSLPMFRAKEVVSPTAKQAQMTASGTSTQNRPSRLTRLNPMSLLTRRRSSQPTSQPDSSLFGSTLPENYVGIRGTRVHDFSAPRPRKIESPRARTAGNSRQSLDIVGDPTHIRSKSGEESSSFGLPSPSPERRTDSPRVHTPVFKENFDDEEQDDPRNKTPALHEDDSPPESYYSDSDSDSEDDAPRDPLLLGDPTFGLFSAPDNAAPPQEFSFIVPSHLAGPPAPPRTPKSRSQTPNHDRSSKMKSFTPPPPAPRSPRSRSQNPSIRAESPKDPRAPRSASTPPPRESRTPSPQLSLPRHSKSNASRFSFDLAGFGSAQEKLLEDKHRQRISKTVRASKISQMSVPETDDGFNSDDPDLGNDIEEEVPGMHVDEHDFPMAKNIASSTLDSTFEQIQPKSQLYTHQNIAMQIDASKSSAATVPQPSKSFILKGSSMFKGQTFTDNDDFYFDDGAIADEDLAATGNFDESVLDDPTYRFGQQTQAPLSVVPEQASQESSEPSTRPMSAESNGIVRGHGHQASTDTSRTSIPLTQPWEKPTTAKRTSMLKNDLTSTSEVPADLTQGNLAAYHDALALAAQKAATEGRFDRDMHGNDAAFHTDELQDLAAYDENQERVTFDDYELEDDDVIAAANADALDYDGEFYGEEFQFYSTSSGGEDSQFGGQFMADVKRSHSGRANGQDPSLTPITEISEWSTRNSMVLFSTDKGLSSRGTALQQPGLAQIADSLQDEDDDLMLASLRRLRHNTFAGSASSLGSGGSGKNSSSPSSSNQVTPRPGTAGKTQAEKNHPLRLQSNGVNDTTPISSPVNTELSPTVRRQFHSKGHSRNSSGAESVAYVQENDGEGSRWVLERRRTAEDGSIQVLGREIVEGGRI